MFSRGKKRREAEAAAEAEAQAAAKAAGEARLASDDVPVEGTMPEVSEVAPLDLAAGLSAPPVPSSDQVPSGDADAVRLFPGFEHEDFEVGFRMGGAVPALVMRWKEGGDWFRLPPMFNRAVLASMDERDTGSDLTRLMRSFGYDVG